MEDLGKFYRYLSPNVVVLVSCGEGEERNIITIAWQGPVSSNPPLHGIAIHPKRHSHGIIEKYEEWVVNLPVFEILKEVHRCGRVSGREVDKFSDTGLTAVPSAKVGAPTIKECPFNVECKLHSRHSLGDHTLFVGEVVHVRQEPGVFDGSKMSKEFSFIGHLGGNDYIDRWGRNVKM